jgi:hypothetical protein
VTIGRFDTRLPERPVLSRSLLSDFFSSIDGGTEIQQQVMGFVGGR